MVQALLAQVEEERQHRGALLALVEEERQHRKSLEEKLAAVLVRLEESQAQHKQEVHDSRQEFQDSLFAAIRDLRSRPSSPASRTSSPVRSMPELNPPVSSDGDEEDDQGCPEHGTSGTFVANTHQTTLVSVPTPVYHQEESPAYHDPLEGRPPMDAQKDKAAEGHPLGQVVGGSPPSEMDRVAEGSALGQVAGGGITDMENTVGKILSRLTVEEPIADSPTSTIPAEEVRPSGRMGTKAAVGTGGSCWGGGIDMGGRGIPWLDRRGRVFPHDPHLLTESKRAATDSCRGIDPG